MCLRVSASHAGHGTDSRGETPRLTTAATWNNVRRNDQWVVLDSSALPGRNFTQGRFGLLIPQNSEVRLSGFGFYPKA